MPLSWVPPKFLRVSHNLLTKIPYIYFMLSDEDDCVSSPCQNGGSCLDDHGCYICQCTNQWLGDNCQGICIYQTQGPIYTQRQRQCGDDACDIVFIEINGVFSRWSCCDFILFSESYISSVTTVFTPSLMCNKFLPFSGKSLHLQIFTPTNTYSLSPITYYVAPKRILCIVDCNFLNFKIQ